MWALRCVGWIGAVIVLTGCASVVDPETVEPMPEEFLLRAAADKSVYQPEEAITLRVELINNTGVEQRVSDLDANSLKFYFGKPQDSAQMDRDPVFSKQEQMGGAIVLAPHESRARTFVLTRTTHYRGGMGIQVHYDPALPGGGARQKVFSNVVPYEVRGEALFQRDADGLILSGDAIRIARQAVGAPVKGAKAILIEDEKGFYKWYVNLELAGAGEEERLVARLVDPYYGRIWGGEVKPFDPQMARDRRFRIEAGIPGGP